MRNFISNNYNSSVRWRGTLCFSFDVTTLYYYLLTTDATDKT